MRTRLSLLCYRLVFICLTPILLLALWIRSFKQPAYRTRILERLGWLPQHMTTNSVVLHAASVGEVLAIQTFVEQCWQRDPHLHFTITTFTPTGSAQVLKIFHQAIHQQRVQHCYWPIDMLFSTWLFLKKLSPVAVVVMETELWPSLMAQIKQRNIPLLLINARLSDKSMRRYARLDWLIRPTLACFSSILSQSMEHQQRYLQLGASIKQCNNVGNLKYDIALTANILQACNTLRELLPEHPNVWLVASTHAGDETLIIAAFKKIKAILPKLLLVIVPRHPECFNACFEHAQQAGLVVQRRTEQTAIQASTDVWLIDTLGELNAFYGIADVVTIAGTFSDIGGHNPLEPALWQKAIIVGSDMRNFKAIQHQLANAQAIQQLTHNNAEALADAVQQLFAAPKQRQLMGERAYQVVLANQGAGQRTVDTLMQLLAKKTTN